MKTVEAKVKFRLFTRADIEIALADPDERLIAGEVDRLFKLYVSNFCEHCKKLGAIPAEIIRIRGRCPIEKVAIELTIHTIRGALGDNALHCNRCGADWVPRLKNRNPRHCPECNSPYWNCPRVFNPRTKKKIK